MAGLRTLEAFLGPALARAGREAGANGAEARNGHADVWDELRREIARSRRFGREFVLVRVTPAPAAVLGRVVRTIDRAWVADGSTYVLLPESDRAAGEAFVARVSREHPEAVTGVDLALAAFPEDGLTSGALLKALQSSRVRPAPRARRRADVALTDYPPVHA